MEAVSPIIPIATVGGRALGDEDRLPEELEDHLVRGPEVGEYALGSDDGLGGEHVGRAAEAEVGEEMEEEDVHEEFGEAVERMGQVTPTMPSAEEVAQHNISHIPYRSWCRHCVRGKGRAMHHQQHRELDRDRARQRPRIHMDYFYLGPREEDKSLPLLAIIEEQSQRTFSVAMPCKGVEHQYPVAVAVRLLRALGLQGGVIKTDTERSIVALRNAVQRSLPDLGFEDAVKGESESNGLIENTVEKLQAQARTLKSHVEERYGLKLNPRHPVLVWLVDYCGTLLSRFRRGPDGFTPYERSTGKAWKIKMPEFAECVLYQPLKGERSTEGKMQPKFQDGIYLGIQEATAMRWIGTPDGVVRAWTVKRRPDEEKWRPEQLAAMIGLPWQLNAPGERTSGRPFDQLPAEIRIELEDEPGEPQAPAVGVEKKGRTYVPRGLYIRRDVELQEYGYTPGCDGCHAAENGLTHRPHSRVCKARIAEEVKKTEAGRRRLDAVSGREDRFVVAVHEKAEREKRDSLEAGGEQKRQRRTATEAHRKPCTDALMQPHAGRMRSRTFSGLAGSHQALQVRYCSSTRCTTSKFPSTAMTSRLWDLKMTFSG